MKVISSRWMPFAIAILLLGFLKIAGCSGGAGCSCGEPLQGGIDSKYKVQNAVQIRLTSHGFNFVEQNTRDILMDMLPDGFDFCIPKTQGSYSYSFNIPIIGRVTIHIIDYRICNDTNAHCNPGCHVHLDINSIDLSPIDRGPGSPNGPPDTIRAKVTLSDIDVKLKLEVTKLISFLSGDGSCTLRIRSNSFPVQAELPLVIDGTSRYLTFGDDINAQILTSGLNLRLSVSGNMKPCISIFGYRLCIPINLCPIMGGLLSFLNNDWLRNNVLLPIAQPLISSAVNNFFNDFKCLACTAGCPSGSFCSSGICKWNSGGCVPIPLGLEGQMNLSDLLAGYATGGASILKYMMNAGGYADVVNSGVSTALIAAFDSDHNFCVPDAQPPSTEALPRLAALNGNSIPGTSSSYLLGLAVSERILNHAAFAAYKSGLLCLQIGYDEIDYLSTANFQLLLPSLRELTKGKLAPMFVKLRPQRPPILELGRGILQRDNNGDLVMNPESGLPVVIEPLLTIIIPDVAIDIYAFAEERYIRLFTLTLDISLPLAIYFTPDNKIVPVIGDIANLASNIRISNSDILREDVSTLNQLIPTLLQTVLPMLFTALQTVQVAIPEFNGFKLVLDDQRVTTLQQGPEKYLTFFAGLEYTPSNPYSFSADTTVEVEDLRVPPAELLALNGQRAPNIPEVDVLFGGTGADGTDENLEYSYKLGNGMWTPFTSRRRVTIKNPILLLQGRHNLFVRARERGDYLTLDPTPATTAIIVDSARPELVLSRRNGKLHLSGQDAVTPQNKLRYSVRFDEGAWSAYGYQTEFPITHLAGGMHKVSARVQDESGNVREKSDRFFTASNESVVPKGGGGSSCSAIGQSGGAVPWILVVLMAGLLLLRRRRQHLFLLIAVMGMGLALAACSDTPPRNDITPTRCTSDADCEEGFACNVEIGVCYLKECRNNADCPDGMICVPDINGDGLRDCVYDRCSNDNDCVGKIDCPNGGVPKCENGECKCGEPCGGACPEGKFCCRQTDACMVIPAACDKTCTDNADCHSLGLHFVCDNGKCNCAAGYLLQVSEPGNLNVENCSLENAVCTCPELDPIPAGYSGRYLDMAASSSDSKIYVSAYNETYGDLMLAQYNPLGLGDQLKWFTVDGIPLDSPVVGGPSGPRGGILEAGPDVGLYTSTVVDAGGNIHMSYYDLTEKRLKYARGKPGGDSFSFVHYPVDFQGDTGRYTSIAVEGNGQIGIAYMTVAISTGSAYKSRLMYARSKVPTPTSPADWDRFLVDEVDLPMPACGAPCPTGEVCVLGTGQCTVPDASGCSSTCDAGKACIGGRCVAIEVVSEIDQLPMGTGLFASLAIDPLNGLPWVVYYDNKRGNLNIARITQAGPDSLAILDGEDSRGNDTGNVGLFCSLHIDSDGTKHISYVNGLANDLWYLKVDGTGGTAELVDSGMRNIAGEPLGPNNPDPSNGAKIHTVALVGADSVVAKDGSNRIRIAYMDQTHLDLLYAMKEPGGKWVIQILAGNETPSAGAFGFFADQTKLNGKYYLGNYNYDLKNNVSGIDFRIAP